jgi:hypothetical protein
MNKGSSPSHRTGFTWHFTVDDRFHLPKPPTNETGEHADYDQSRFVYQIENV